MLTFLTGQIRVHFTYVSGLIRNVYVFSFFKDQIILKSVLIFWFTRMESHVNIVGIKCLFLRFLRTVPVC